MTSLIAQLVAVACAELGAPQLVGPATTLALQLAAMIPEAKLESFVMSIMREGAKWLITRPPGPESTAPDLGGNVPASFGDGPPARTNPEPEDGRDPPA